VLGIGVAVNDPESLNVGAVIFFGMLIGVPWAVGRMVHHRRKREIALEERADALEREQDQRARAAVAEERQRIARELHDVVAHAISVIVVQARGGRRMLDAEPAEARGAFDTIERTGQEALGEMRRLLGLLRESEEEVALAPQPTLARLDELVGQVRDAGLPVELAIEGHATELPPGVDLSAYRIVQEALTNALKHAGPATARVTIRYAADNLELETSNAGTSADEDDKTIAIGAASISSAANQSFSVGDAATSISTITITDDASSATITATNDIRIKIQDKQHSPPEISARILMKMKESAEAYLRGLGFRQVRVRHEGDTARIEVAPDDVPRLRAVEGDVAGAFRRRGYGRVVVDPRGYRSTA